MSKYSAIREKIKELAAESRNSKSRYKTAQRAAVTRVLNLNWSTYIGDIASARCSMTVDRYYNRHFHLAYGIIKGRTLEQMESKVAFGNEPDMQQVEEMIKLIQEKYLKENRA